MTSSTFSFVLQLFFTANNKYLKAKSYTMKFLLPAAASLLFFSFSAQSQITEKKNIVIKKTAEIIKIDGVINEIAWKNAAIADKFTEFQPTPFTRERTENKTEVYFLYNNDGIYIGGYYMKKQKTALLVNL